jgi:hypothetical protein
MSLNKHICPYCCREMEKGGSFTKESTEKTRSELIERTETAKRLIALEKTLRAKYGEYRDYSAWDLAKEFFTMSNDDFFLKYGFNYVPRGQLWEDAKDYLARMEKEQINQRGFYEIRTNLPPANDITEAIRTMVNIMPSAEDLFGGSELLNGISRESNKQAKGRK